MREPLQWEVWLSTKEPGNDRPILSVTEPVDIDRKKQFQDYLDVHLKQLKNAGLIGMGTRIINHLAPDDNSKRPDRIRFALLTPWLEAKRFRDRDDPLIKQLLVAALMKDHYSSYGMQPATILDLFSLLSRSDHLALLRQGTIAAPGTVVHDFGTNDYLIPVAAASGYSVAIGLQSDCPFALPENFMIFGAVPDRYLCYIPA